MYANINLSQFLKIFQVLVIIGVILGELWIAKKLKQYFLVTSYIFILIPLFSMG